jgi:hypothetical protein
MSDARAALTAATAAASTAAPPGAAPPPAGIGTLEIDGAAARISWARDTSRSGRGNGEGVEPIIAGGMHLGPKRAGFGVPAGFEPDLVREGIPGGGIASRWGHGDGEGAKPIVAEGPHLGLKRAGFGVPEQVKGGRGRRYQGGKRTREMNESRCDG